ncbi:hypothetical protein Ciccas_001239 [Cichlidogyrus casuarinus]|uniref:Transmembrane protein 161B n=1 Tax=Cichlidogyrus casuarinus TaxID=1844966 RepID=A0ABD2QKL2_9PLAT
MFRYLPPTDDDLLEASGQIRSKDKKKYKRVQIEDEFNVPRTTEIVLLKAKIAANDISNLPFYIDFLWIVDFALCTSAVYIVSELLQAYLPSAFYSNSIINSRFNLSLLWWILAFFFAFKSLISAASIYFKRNSCKGSDFTTPEFAVICGSGFTFFVLAFLCLTLDGIYFDFKLKTGYINLSKSADDEAPIFSMGAFQTGLALFSGIVGGLFIFPGMRYSKMYLDGLHDSSIFTRFFSHINFICPLLCSFLWCLPVINQILPLTLSSLAAVFSNSHLNLLLVPTMNFISWLQPNKVISLRLLSVLLYVMLRASMIKSHIKAFLQMARDKVTDLKLEPGKITNKEIQRIVSSVFCCINLVAVQYAAPCILTASLLCLYKNFTGPSTCWFPWHSSIPYEHIDMTGTTITDPDFLNSYWFSSLVQTRKSLLSLLEIWSERGQNISHCVLGFSLWWTLICWQIVSFVGVIYHRYASHI